MRPTKLDHQFTSLDLARKIYLNSYQCMWNDAMKAAGERNCFYFSDPEMAKKVTESGQKTIRQMMKIFGVKAEDFEPNTNNTMIPDKLEKYVEWMHTFEKKVADFHDSDFYDGFKPYRDGKDVPDGTYLTIRCGLGGIYTVINFFKDGQWMAEALDNSTTVAYRPLKNGEDFNENKNY